MGGRRPPTRAAVPSSARAVECVQAMPELDQLVLHRGNRRAARVERRSGASSMRSTSAIRARWPGRRAPTPRARRRRGSGPAPRASPPVRRRSRGPRGTAFRSRRGTPRRRWPASLGRSRPPFDPCRTRSPRSAPPSRAARRRACRRRRTAVPCPPGGRDRSARGRPFMTVDSATKCPSRRPALPRVSSATSGFRFCGIMLDPVLCRSGSLANPNSAMAHSTTSSARRDRCVPRIEHAARNSSAKSRSETASIELTNVPSNPSRSAIASTGRAMVEPASAPAPRAQTLEVARAPRNRPASRARGSACARR